MQTLQDIHDKIFLETKSILETLSKINSKDELLAKQDLFGELTDRIGFLRILEKNEDTFSKILSKEIAVQEAQSKTEEPEQLKFNKPYFEEEPIEEEIVFANDGNHFEDEISTEEEIINDSVQTEVVELASEPNEKEIVAESHIIDENKIPLIIEQEAVDYAQRVAQKERDLEEMEERRRKIVEISKHESAIENRSEVTPKTTVTPLQEAEKRFKLAHIKGLKVVQNLFDNDPLEDEQEESRNEPGSILSTNVQTDFMQAERKKAAFKLDLNDKVAFTKSLFAGDEQELKSTIDHLNNFDKLEDAKQYLSELYYQKDWSKVDEFAQRLWNLVESKF